MRRRLALVTCVLIAAASVNPALVRVGFLERDKAREMQTVYGIWPGYDEFLAGVRAATKPGDAILILVPSREWERGYGAGYLRAVYKLTTRSVLPVMTPDGRLLRRHFDEATHIAVWRGRYDDERRAVVWAGHEGQLMGPRR